MRIEIKKILEINQFVNVPVIEFVPALFELMTLPAGIQDLASHVKVLNLPFRPHVAVPPPENPSLHVTVTICPVVPVILPVPALFELTTLPAGIQSKSHVNVLN